MNPPPQCKECAEYWVKEGRPVGHFLIVSRGGHIPGAHESPLAPPQCKICTDYWVKEGSPRDLYLILSKYGHIPGAHDSLPAPPIPPPQGAGTPEVAGSADPVTPPPETGTPEVAGCADPPVPPPPEAGTPEVAGCADPPVPPPPPESGTPELAGCADPPVPPPPPESGTPELAGCADPPVPPPPPESGTPELAGCADPPVPPPPEPVNRWYGIRARVSELVGKLFVILTQKKDSYWPSKKKAEGQESKRGVQFVEVGDSAPPPPPLGPSEQTRPEAGTTEVAELIDICKDEIDQLKKQVRELDRKLSVNESSRRGGAQFAQVIELIGKLFVILLSYWPLKKKAEGQESKRGVQFAEVGSSAPAPPPPPGPSEQTSPEVAAGTTEVAELRSQLDISQG